MSLCSSLVDGVCLVVNELAKLSSCDLSMELQSRDNRLSYMYLQGVDDENPTSPKTRMNTAKSKGTTRRIPVGSIYIQREGTSSYKEAALIGIP